MNFCVPCLFGLEGPVAGELRRLGIPGVRAENGRVFFEGGVSEMAKANIALRCGERVLLQMGAFSAASFDGLFEGVRALPWEEILPRNAKFPVKGHSLNSQLHSVPDCQRIIKKAVAERLKAAYGGGAWLPEDGELYQLQFSIMKDEAALFIDTSGAGLSRRGYRPENVGAPLRETLAAALVGFSGYRSRGDFCDPFCGGGTIAIEAALAAKGRAPGLLRTFSAEAWEISDKGVWAAVREELKSREYDGEYHIFASDIDPKAIEIARRSAERAGVSELISFETADAAQFARETARGVIVTNPPYGERLMEKREAEEIYAGFGRAFARLRNWSLFLLSSHTEFERSFGREADKKRKLYNGMIKCELYMYDPLR